MRDELLSAIADLVDDVLAHGGDAEVWAADNQRAVERATSVFAEIRRGGDANLTKLTVALRQLRNLVPVDRPRELSGGCSAGTSSLGHPWLVPVIASRPSPTGMFHVGSARSALFNWILAKQEGGTFVLRIEDTDTERNRPEWTQGIIDAMAWLGMSAEDPVFEGPVFQSANVDAHVAAAVRLHEAGLGYYCDCTRDTLVARTGDQNQGYDGFCRDRGLEPGPGRAMRFRVPPGSTTVHDLVRGDVVFEHEHIEDFVVLRGNGSPLFLLANVADDLAQRITHVIRGEEHFPNTPKQQLLWQALGAEPPTWAHIRCSSTRPARSSRSVATRSRSSSTATRAT